MKRHLEYYYYISIDVSIVLFFRPSQYGSDMLPLLSELLSSSSSDHCSVAVCALQGLRALCEAQVKYSILFVTNALMCG